MVSSPPTYSRTTTYVPPAPSGPQVVYAGGSFTLNANANVPSNNGYPAHWQWNGQMPRASGPGPQRMNELTQQLGASGQPPSYQPPAYQPPPRYQPPSPGRYQPSNPGVYQPSNPGVYRPSGPAGGGGAPMGGGHR